MKKIITVSFLTIALLASSLLVTSFFDSKQVSASETENEGKTIQVSGKGVVKITPDVAYVSLGVHTENVDAKKAQEENKTKMNKVVAALKKLGIAEKEIKTINYNIYPNYSYKDNESKIDKYIVENTIEITINKIDTVGTVIDEAVKAGTNVSNSIRFSVKDSNAAYNQALVQAVTNAKQKATTIADTLGVKITTPKAVIESGGNPNPIYYQQFENAKMDMAERETTSISSGDLEITANVNVTYEY